MKYKISERFKSIQGEGWWAGTPMAFVRLSQCPVGGAEGICTSWDGTRFTCDTGKAYTPRKGVEHHPYTEVNEELDAREILEWSRPYSHLCITGGEPFIYDLKPIYELATVAGGYPKIHVETSGTTLPEPMSLLMHHVWVTLSPKKGWRETWKSIVSEIKILVHVNTTLEDIQSLLRPFSGATRRVFLQPIEDDGQLLANTHRAVELCHLCPSDYRLSLQLQKVVRVR